MVALYKVTATINGITRTCEIVGKNPTFEKYQSRIERELNIKPKDKVENVKFEELKSYLGL